MSALVIAGDTSGTITISAPAVAGTNTLTLPASTGTLLDSRLRYLGLDHWWSARASLALYADTASPILEL
jgi:hypothetical protein